MQPKEDDHVLSQVRKPDSRRLEVLPQVRLPARPGPGPCRGARDAARGLALRRAGEGHARHRLSFKIGRIVAAAVAIIAFFLPIVSFGAFGISASMSPMQMATGTEVMGFDMDGQAENFLFLAIGVLALVLALLPGRAGAIGGIVSGVLTIGFLLLWQSQAIRRRRLVRHARDWLLPLHPRGPRARGAGHRLAREEVGLLTDFVPGARRPPCGASACAPLFATVARTSCPGWRLDW